MANVLITGASAGIGFETALAFARAGHTVAATMRRPSRAPALAEVAAREQLPIVVSAMDVDDDASVRDGVRRIAATLGPVDVLVNNAGIERMGAVEELPLDDFKAVMQTNYFGVIRCLQAVLPSMRTRRSGCIVNVSSVSGHIAASPTAAYAASKYALEALSECLAQEVKPFGVRVLIVEPGIIDTAMARNIGVALPASAYPHQQRFAAMFRAALRQPVPPAFAAAAIRDLVESGTWQLRHLVGPDAAPFVGWRKAMSDEDWVAWGALDDEAWYARVLADFGIDARS